MFCFGTISSVADKEGILHHIADPPEKKPSLKISRKARTKQEIAQPPALRAKTTSYKPGAENSFARRTPLSTSSTENGHELQGKKRNKRDKGSSSCPSGTSALKGEQKEACRHGNSILPRRPLHRGRVESSPISDDEPTVPGEEPPQREARRRRNRHCNARRHYEARERDMAQPVSRDEISDVGETPDERVFRERRNSHRRDRRQAQEQAEQEARQRRENPLFGRNLNPDFARAMNTPSEVGGVLARIADGLPRLQTPRAIGSCSLGQLIIFCLSLILRAIYDTPSTVSGTRGASSMLRANDDMRTRSGAERSMIGIMTSLHEVRPLGLSRQRLQLAAQPGGDRGSTSATPLPETDTIIVNRRTHVEYQRSLRVSGPFSGPQTSKSPMSTNTNLSKTREAG
jgi:hypothetical protein